MKVVIQVAHPAHVHFYKFVIEELIESGVDLLVLARDKEITVELLEKFEIKHKIVSQQNERLKIRDQLTHSYKTYKAVKSFQPDVMTGIGGLTAAHVSTITNTDEVIFTDTENATIHNKLTFPFAKRIYTPESYRDDIGQKQVRYPGYHELAYLHPNRFNPDRSVLKENGINPDKKYAVLRFIGWDAYHDTGKEGLTKNQKKEMIDSLSDFANIYITSEHPLPTELDNHRVPVESHQIHHLLSFADLYAGDSGTMATEAAVLGTPAVRYRPFRKDNDLGNFIELEEKYGLLYSTSNPKDLIRKSEQILSDKTLRQSWREKRSNLMNDKIDVTNLILDTLERVAQNK